MRPIRTAVRGPLHLLLFIAPLIDNEHVHELVISLSSSAMDGITIALVLYVGYSWRMIFASFRRHTLMIRRGEYPFPKSIREEQANRYIGYQVSHFTIAFFVLTASFALIAVLVTPVIISAEMGTQLYRDVLDATWRLVRTVLLVSIPVLFQIVANRFIFFRRSWILHRAFYAIYDYNLIYTNALIGLFAVTSRVIFIAICTAAALEPATAPSSIDC